MKKINLFAALLTCVISISQVAHTSFEEPPVFSIEYTDTGDANVPHDLINNANEPFVDYSSVGGELGFNARYVPYDSPGDGLTDGDLVGVTDTSPSGSFPFPEGLQGYEISDVDGNFILEFEPVLISSPTVSLDFFVSETGYEGDGTQNSSGSDRLRIYVKDLGDNMEYDLLDTTGSDINDLGIEGRWETISLSIEDSPNITVQLIIEARTNSGAEAFYFDNIEFVSILDIEDMDASTFSLYPNPASYNYVNVISKKAGPKEVEIYNILGEVVNKVKLNNDQLDISHLPSGLYLVKISQGNVSVIKKLVIKQ